MIRYTKLGDDLDAIMGSFETNPALTERQRRIWRSVGKHRAVTHAMFGFDHEKALTFEDGTTVGSMKSNSARRFWDYAAGHVFAPLEDVIRFCLFMHLDMYGTLVLLLKAQWERFYAHEVKGWRASNGTNLTDVLLDTDEHALRDAHMRFKPRRDLYDLLADMSSRHAPVNIRPDGRPFLEGHTPSTFFALVDEMLLGRYHFYSVGSAEVAHFTGEARREFALLVEGTGDEQRTYPLEKARWVSLRQELEDLYLLIENQRLKNAHTRREWLAIFGAEEIELTEAALEYERADIRYNLKMTNAGWTAEEVERYIAQEEGRRHLELMRLKTEAALAPHLVRTPEAGESGGRVEPTGYLKECKTVLRQIRRLLHPDRLAHHPSYGDLTDGQREKLDEMLLAALEVRPDELGYPEGYMLHDMRSLEGLKSALSRIEAILGNPGVDTDERLTIAGGTLPEKLAWLKRENRILEEEILSGKAELQALFEDEYLTNKRAVLCDRECHEQVRMDLRARAAGLRADAGRLQKAFEALFES